MSHQTGIKANENLKNFFAVSKSGDIRMFKVSIEREQLTLDGNYNVVGSLQHDFDDVIKSLAEEGQPCYIFCRLDTRNSQGYEWLFISYSPDNSPVKQKMLYASTKATLKQEFGAGQIKDELFGTTLADISFEGYQRHIKAKLAPKPFSQAEQELLEVRKQETGGIDNKRQTVQGVAFPLTSKAMAALDALKVGQVNYVQFSLELKQETIEVEKQKQIEVKRLASLIPTDHPRYHVFNYQHHFQGTLLNSLIFIYSMPGNACSIKERMTYSTCKAPFLDVIQGQYGLPIARRLEVSDGDELTEPYLHSEVHPEEPVSRAQPSFQKPRAPNNRGPRRIIK